MIYRPLTRFKIENNNKRLLQLQRKTNPELIVTPHSSSNLGNAYQGLIKFKTAINYQQHRVEIPELYSSKTTRESKHRNIGNAHQSQGQFKTAIQYHQRHLQNC